MDLDQTTYSKWGSAPKLWGDVAICMGRLRVQEYDMRRHDLIDDVILQPLTTQNKCPEQKERKERIKAQKTVLYRTPGFARLSFCLHVFVLVRKIVPCLRGPIRRTRFSYRNRCVCPKKYKPLQNQIVLSGPPLLLPCLYRHT